MSIRQRDINRKELVKAIIRQNGGRIFTVVARRKEPKVSYVHQHLVGVTLKPSEWKKLTPTEQMDYTLTSENFMTMTCRTGVKKDLKGGASTIANHDDLISVFLTNNAGAQGYRCFSAFNVLELRAGGTEIKFREEDVLSFEG